MNEQERRRRARNQEQKPIQTPNKREKGTPKREKWLAPEGEGEARRRRRSQMEMDNQHIVYR